MEAFRSIPVDTPVAVSAADVARLNTLFGLLHPTLADLAATLELSPLQFVEWFASPAVAEHCDTLTTASERLNHLLSLGALAPALAKARALLEPADPAVPPDPAEQRRIITAVLRTTAPHPVRSRPCRAPRPVPGPAGSQAGATTLHVDHVPRAHPAATPDAQTPATPDHRGHTATPTPTSMAATTGCEPSGLGSRPDACADIPLPFPRPRRGVHPLAHDLLAAAGTPTARPP